MKRSKPLRKKRRGNPKNKLWPIVSEYIRKRDADENGMVKCISCPSIKHWSEMQAGHFVASSVSLAIRFNEKNIHAQCAPCNCYDTRSIHRYTIAMRQKYGPDIVEELDALRRKGEGTKYYKGDYEELIQVFTQKLESLK